MISEKINEEIKAAMRAKDQVRLDTLRMLKSKILAVNARGEVSDGEAIKLFKTYAGNLQEALEQAEAVNRPELVAKLKTEVQVVQEFLPKAPSAAELKNLVAQAVEQTGAKTKRDFGQVMKALMQLNPHIDGKLAKEEINQLLPDA